ncbi:hypothetical protein RT99_16455 [Flavobacterium sp. MEB061]|uniref:ATP-binding protein n=1 Tax=Flavobacterium sp. MEB061 TaxID=1587524 RepID=UPI0005ABEE0E|nr:ATP-binding protein [Flavobacterium sp. MEB061]KIQ18626.1 hypothetical protein RT99_16455 [Flavobacterium sp. MEB061]
MKISKLHINQFRHLENLDFDFTYPEDFHIEEKRGKPLEKICFIGQSATGKTGLLELIYQESYRLQKAVRFEEIPEHKTLNFNESRGVITFATDIVNQIFEIEKTNQDAIFYQLHTKKNFSEKEIEELIPFKEELNLLYFKANLISEANIDIFTKNPIDLIEAYRKNTEVNIENLLDKRSFSNRNLVFNDNVNPNIWLYLLSEILEYRKNFTQRISELIHIKDGSVDLSNLGSEIQKWQIDNPNKVELFAEKFNPILKKLSLEIDIVNTLYPIPIKNKKTNVSIPIESASTGTKGLLLSFLPLYKLNTKDSIILIDEPERSLYPDMQMDLMDYYKNLAPEAQFIVATHSPFIAASFEPEERFILHFDKEGKVQVKSGKSPIGDDPNDMLYNDFEIDYINKYGKKVYNEYLEKRRQLLFEKNEEIKQKLQDEIESIGDKYNF